MYIDSFKPTISTSIYADKDHLGTVGSLQPTGETRGAPTSVLKSVTIVDDDKQDSDLHLYFFSQTPTLVSSDNAALNIADADMEYCLGKVTIAAADYESLSANSVATKEVNLPVKPEGDNGTIYCMLMSGGTPTYTSTTALTVKCAFE